MQWRPIAHKYRQGKVKSTLQACVCYIYAHCFRGIEKKVKSPNYYTYFCEV